MLFGPKNARVMYQRMATTLLHDIIHKVIEVYVDDMMVKSLTRKRHFESLDKFMSIDKKFNLRLNPNKYVFGVASGKLLGDIVSKRVIEVNLDKVKAISEMPVPKIEKEVRGFIG